MSPHYNSVRDGNATAIPETYLPPGYVPSGFRLFRSEAKGKTHDPHSRWKRFKTTASS